MGALNKLKETGIRGITCPKSKGRPKSSDKSWKVPTAFVSNFLVYNGQLQTAVSPRFLTQPEWKRHWWKAYKVSFHMEQFGSNWVQPFGRYVANSAAYAGWDRFCSICKMVPFDLSPNDLIRNSLCVLKHDILRVLKSIFSASCIQIKLQYSSSQNRIAALESR